MQGSSWKKITLERLWVDKFKGGFGLLELNRCNQQVMAKWILYLSNEKSSIFSTIFKNFTDNLAKNNISLLNFGFIFSLNVAWKDILLYLKNLYFNDEGLRRDFNKIVSWMTLSELISFQTTSINFYGVRRCFSYLKIRYLLKANQPGCLILILTSLKFGRGVIELT